MSPTPTPEPVAPEPVAPETAAPEPTAGERLSWMAKNSKLLIIALIVIVVAVVAAAFSFSLFTSSSANPGNTVGSGIMQIDNDKEGQAILLAENMLPGDSADGQVSITNVGDADGDFTLSASGLTDTPADPAFSDVLTLVVVQDGDEIYNGLISDFTQADLGTWGAGDKHVFSFTVTFDQAAGNEYQGAKTQLTFKWDATQST
jgi:hypothetical protein